MELNCQDDWETLDNQIFPESHFLRMKFDPNYEIKTNFGIIKNRSYE